MSLDPYSALGIAPNAPLGDIRRAYRRQATKLHPAANRSHERRVGKECVIPQRSRWSPYHTKNHDHHSTRHPPSHTNTSVDATIRILLCTSIPSSNPYTK